MCINTRNGAAWNTVIASGRVLTFEDERMCRGS